MPDFVIISDAFWDDPYWVSRHHVPKALAANHRVLYVERATTWITPLAYKEPWSTLYKGIGLSQKLDQLWSYRPRPRMPFDRRYRTVSKLNQRMLAHEINRTIKQLGFTDPHLISFDHKAAKLFQHVQTRGKRCYYVVDEISEFNWPLASRETVAADEREAILASDLAIATSAPLLEKCLLLNPASHLLSHGVDVDAYLTPGISPPEDLLSIPAPRVGFIGKIEEWVDLDMVESLAQRHPQASLVFVGPISTDVSTLKTYPNVHFLGARPRERVPAYLSGFDVGLIPFKQNELTRNVNPLKLYEYLAAGLPVLSTPMNAVQADAGLGVLVGSTPDEISAHLSRILVQDPPENRIARQQYASRHSWRSKAGWLAQRLSGDQ